MRAFSLKPIASSLLLECVPQPVRVGLMDSGYCPAPQAAAHVARDGTVSARVVWRNRVAGGSIAHTFQLRGALPDSLLDALVTALDR